MVIEKHLFDYIHKYTDNPVVEISEDYLVDIKECRQIHIANKDR